MSLEFISQYKILKRRNYTNLCTRAITHFPVAQSFSIKARHGTQQFIQIEFNLHLNEISFSYERKDTKTRFEKEAKGNRPFYSCLLGDLAFEWQRGWRWPCIDTDLSAFVMQMHLVSIETTWFTQQRQCIKTRSPPASLPSKGQVTEQTTVKWSIRKLFICERLDQIPLYSRDTTALQLNRGSITSSPQNSKLSREKSSTQTKACSLQLVFYTGPDFNTKMSALYILCVSNNNMFLFSKFTTPQRQRNHFKLLWG